MYHRVSATSTSSDPWGLTVSESDFVKQIEILARERRSRATLSGLADSSAQVRSGQEPVFVTFDDGYADNFSVALPVLERFEVPATIFISDGSIGATTETWWDELDRILLSTPDLPETLEMRVANHDVVANLNGSSTNYAPELRWRASPTARGDGRQQLFLSVWRQLNVCADAERETALATLAAWANVSRTPRPEYEVLAASEVRALAQSDLIEIGSHGTSHTSLPLLDDAALARETAGSRAKLQCLTGQPIASFAFPSGRFDRRTVAAVESAGYTRAVTTVGRRVAVAHDRLQLPRFQIHNLDESAFKRLIGAQ